MAKIIPRKTQVVGGGEGWLTAILSHARLADDACKDIENCEKNVFKINHNFDRKQAIQHYYCIQGIQGYDFALKFANSLVLSTLS